MSTLYLTLGTGGYYTGSITSAFSDMLTSGVADPTIDNFILDILDGSYTGVFNGYIPNTGVFNIIGKQTYVKLTQSITTLSGKCNSDIEPCFILKDVVVDCSGAASNWFIIHSGFGLYLDNVQLINNFKGILNSGYFGCSKTNSCGLSGTASGSYFIYSASGKHADISSSNISCYNTGIYGTMISLYDSIVHNNDVGIYASGNSYITINKSLMHHNTIDINTYSGELSIDRSTLADPVYINGTEFYGNEIITSTADINISGSAQSNSFLNYSCIYPSSVLHPNISTIGTIVQDPKFVNPSNGDYRLQFGLNGSPCINFTLNPSYENIQFNIDATKLILEDNVGEIKTQEYIDGLHLQGDTLVFSDFDQEINFAKLFNNRGVIKYKIEFNALFEKSDITLKNSFDPVDGTIDPHPWDWDNIEIQTPKISDYNTYIIPRSYFNFEELIYTDFNVLTEKINFGKILYDNIKLYKRPNFKGISYDEDLSTPDNSISWVIDGTNQALIKRNVYSEEELEYFPLFCKTPTKGMIRPSGLIYTGVKGDYYTFIKYSDPNKEVICPNEYGDFYWVATGINPNYDLRGIKSYKDNLFITAGQYIGTVLTNRYNVPLEDSIGFLLQYNSSDHFFNFIKSPDLTDPSSPKMYLLQEENNYPTDITTYEDGSILIADYLSLSGIFKYRFAYDYAIIGSRYDNEARVLLREYYNTVDL